MLAGRIERVGAEMDGVLMEMRRLPKNERGCTVPLEYPSLPYYQYARKISGASTWFVAAVMVLSRVRVAEKLSGIRFLCSEID